MQFTHAAFALLAAVSLVEAGGIAKIFTGKRDLQSIHARFAAAGAAPSIASTFQDCCDAAKETLVVTIKSGATNTYYLKSSQGDLPAACLAAGNNYILTADSVSGTLTASGTTAFLLQPLPADEDFFQSAAQGKSEP